MKLTDRVKKSAQLLFGYDIVSVGGRQRTTSTVPRTVAGKRITIKLVDFLQQLTAFSDMQDEEIQEQLFIWDPEIGGALDRQSTLISQCYKGPYLKDDDDTTSELEDEMLEKAVEQSDAMKMENLFETYGELCPLFGDVFIDNRDLMTQRVIPNRFVTLVETPDQVGRIQPGVLMTEANYLVFNEMLPGQFVLGPGEWIHLKYKDTPVFCTDRKGRWTFGMYSVSPVQRAVISAWQGRITSIIDILQRWKILPREVHSIDSTIFSLDQGTGSQMDRLSEMQTEANKYITSYNSAMQDQQPDQGYTVLDTVKIEMLESKSNTYMKTNELIEQLDSKKWVAMNMPKSVVTGDGAGSYASELVISNYVSTKALQLAKKIKPMLLENLRKRLKAINPAYPVEKLDLKLELSMATTDLEMFRQGAIMGTLNCFTQDEIRAKLGYQPLTEEQKKQIAQVEKDKLNAEVTKSNAIAGIGKNPETPQSSEMHKQDKGQQIVTKAQS